MRMKLITGLAMAIAFGASAHATEFVQNGSFSSVTTSAASGSFEFDPGHSFGAVANWSIVNGPGQSGYDILYNTANWTNPSFPSASTQPLTQFPSQNQNIWQAPAGAAALGVGGNVVGMDGAAGQRGTLEQTIHGLTAGQTYILTFDWAAGQVLSRTAFQNLTEYLTVGLGSQFQNTTTDTYAPNSSSPWQKVTMQFTATGADEVLSFLSTGTPGGDPPIAFLDNVSLTNAVPEPATWGLMIIGAAAVGASMRNRRRALRTLA